MIRRVVCVFILGEVIVVAFTAVVVVVVFGDFLSPPNFHSNKKY